MSSGDGQSGDGQKLPPRLSAPARVWLRNRYQERPYREVWLTQITALAGDPRQSWRSKANTCVVTTSVLVPETLPAPHRLTRPNETSRGVFVFTTPKVRWARMASPAEW